MTLYHITYQEWNDGTIDSVVPWRKLYSSLEAAKEAIKEDHKEVDTIDPSELTWQEEKDGTVEAAILVASKWGDEVPVWSWTITPVKLP